MIERRTDLIALDRPESENNDSLLLLAQYHTIDSKLITVENRSSDDLQGTYVPVKRRHRRTFARVVRSFLRQDPDRLMVCETRDLDTAQELRVSVPSGHLGFTSCTPTTRPGDHAFWIYMCMSAVPWEKKKKFVPSTLEAGSRSTIMLSICRHMRTTYESRSTRSWRN